MLTPLGVNAAPLYNGNIAAMAVSLAKINKPLVYNYHYDQLNRLVNMEAYTGLTNSGFTLPGTAPTAYKEQVTYDPNGNIMTYKRNGDAARVSMDDMSYSYKPSTNQLDRVVDAAPDAAASDYDKYRDIKQGQATSNYTYDAIGNLTSDVSEGLMAINWSVYDKILSIVKNGNTIAYSYDASGNRISKTANGTTTVYVRDASGNVMSIYEKTASTALKQTELHLYGSSRLGIVGEQTVEPVPVSLATGYDAAIVSVYTRNEKSFELSNHLGNVLVAVSDKKVGLDGNSDGAVDYYTADIVSAQDYYPFGMLMPGRKYQAPNAVKPRYGFNGMEKDNEMYGDGNAYDFGARIQDTRLGRWLSVDPLQKKYPSVSPYAFALNNPNFYYDLDGRDVGVTIVRNPQGGGTITFSATTYVTGINAEQKVAAFNDAYKLFVKANPDMKSSDGKWNVEIKMIFVNANDIKHQVAEKQEMAAENYMNIKVPSKGDSRAHSGMPLPGSSDKGSIVDVDPTGNNGKGLRLGTSTASGRFAQLYTNDGGRIGIHEELHNWGIGDYYADASYQWQMVDNKTRKIEQSGTTGGISTPYVGFEGTIMSAGEGFYMPQVTADDLVNTALRTSEVKKSDNFVMARKVDGGRPNGSTDVGQVPKTKTEKTKTKTTTYSNPVYKSAGN